VYARSERSRAARVKSSAGAANRCAVHRVRNRVSRLFCLGGTRRWCYEQDGMAQVETATEHAHHVQFYESPTRLAQRVVGYLREALDQHGAAIAAARATHLEQFTRELARVGFDTDKLVSEGRLYLLDADAILAKLLVEDRIDAAQFDSLIAATVRRVRAPRLHVYGELVDLLLASGKRQALFELEALWAELMDEQPFSLLCGYSLGAFDGDVATFDNVVACHHTATGTHRVSEIHADVDTARMLAALEQRAHALQFEVDRRTRVETRMSALLRITSELARASTRDAILDVVTLEVPAALDASACAVWTKTDDGRVLELIAASGGARASTARHHRLSVDSDSPFARVTRENEPLFLGSLAKRTTTAHDKHDDTLSASHVAMAVIPLSSGGPALGTLCFMYSHARQFDEADRDFKVILANHLALALERVQLVERERALRQAAERAALAEKQALAALAVAYREEREAHIQAEDATRAREELISVVSHDLRNPLGTIMMAATALLKIDVGDRTQRVRIGADRIHRQALRMARLIEDLVDFAGIQAGRLELEPAFHAPTAIVSTTCEIFGPIAQERGLTLATEVTSDLPAIRCDSDRAVQVLSNLVSNALKVTPRGGAIAIGAQPTDKEIVFYVRDTGPGIEADELPTLFERYWRGKQSSYKGAGLGLSIARGIVDAHGGRIWAESRVGQGAVFYFSLTPAN
jgi:signal transduction histidine kinase